VEHRQEQMAAVYVLDVFGPELEDIASQKDRSRTALGRRATGRPTSTTPRPVDAKDEDIILLASHAANGAKFRKLYEQGDLSNHADDASRADMALVGMLAFYAGPDPDRLDRLFRNSALMRDKWERDDYRTRTIEKAMVRDSYYDWQKHDAHQDVDIDLSSSWDIADDEEKDMRAQDGQRPEADVSKYLADLSNRGVPAVKIAENTFQIEKCPCCGIPGTFSVGKDGEGYYRCGGGKRTWAEGRSLWKAHRSNNAMYTVTDILATPDPEWLILDHLPKRGVSVIYGPPEIAKSFFELGRAMAVAYGIEYLGCPTRQGKVVYLYSEGQIAIKRRVKAWLTHADIPFADPRLANIVFHFKRYDLSMDQHIENLTDNIQQWGRPDLVVIDTLSKNFRASENEDMSRMVAAAYDIVETLDCAVDIVHHTGKDQNRGPRGGSQLVAEVDQTIEMEGVRDPSAENQYCGCRVIPRKLKDGRKLAPYYLDYHEYQFSPRSHDHSIVLVRSEKSADEHRKQEARAKQADEDVEFHRFMSLFPDTAEKMPKDRIEAIMAKNGIGQRACRRLFTRAVADGKVRNQPGATSGKLWWYERK
jgi:hypothetical protein